jgi:hypothetical protein
VLDARTGTVWLLLTHNLGSDTEAAITGSTSEGTRPVWLARSTDDGASRASAWRSRCPRLTGGVSRAAAWRRPRQPFLGT